MEKIYSLIENYIYLYHTDTLIILPGYPDSITDSLPVSFNPTTPLSRTAPIYSYANSGPRSLQISLSLHRDMMKQVNYNNTRLKLNQELKDDYVDIAIKQLQAAAYPRYAAAQKMVDPPLVAVRLGNDIFIKGIIQGSVSETYKLPILRNGKYACIDISFTIAEVDPYGADEVAQIGSFRGLNTSLERRIYTAAGTSRGPFGAGNRALTSTSLN